VAEALRYTWGLVTEQRRTRKVIAIDGPSGVGKGTVARAIADAFGYRHVDTGAMYRALAWRVIDLGIDPENEPAVFALASRSDIVMANGQVAVDGVDVSSAIRTPQIDRTVTSVARMPSVRELFVVRQRALGRDGGIVMEGRDIGTVVFPDADVKIYLDASPEERARRRAADPAHGGRGEALATVASAMADRDRIDSTRAASPLMISPDAVVVDTTGVPVPDVVARVIEIIGDL
jgi:cytidylate kinase